MTHSELVKMGDRSLKNTVKCSFSLSELTSLATEIPDNIGWKCGYSILIECKSTRSDFLNDKKKAFRRRPQSGMGNYRFYLCPPAIIKPVDLPDKWGLLYCKKKKIEIVVGPIGNIWEDIPRFKSNIEAENILMQSALRRLSEKGCLNLLKK